MKLERIVSYGLPFETVVFLSVLPGKLTVRRPTLAEQREGKCPYATVTVPDEQLPADPWPPYVYRGIFHRGGTDVVISPANHRLGPAYYGDPVDDVINGLKDSVDEVERMGELADARNVEFVTEAYTVLCGDPGFRARDKAQWLDDWLDNAYNNPTKVFDLMRRMQQIYQL